MAIDPVEHLERIPWESQTEDGQVLLSPSWEAFVLGISVLSVFNLLLLLLMENRDIDQVVVIMDAILVVVFLADVVRRLIVARDYRAYLGRGRGWIDVLSIVPLLRIFRLLRILRAIRVLRRMGGTRRSLRTFFADKAAGGLLSVVFVAVLVMEFGALSVLAVERGAPRANITTAEDAVWYLIVTMSTVGYGDHYPVTDVGRVIGSLIIVIGVGVFGTLTGFLANAFLAPSATRGMAVAEADRGLDTEPASSTMQADEGGNA